MEEDERTFSEKMKDFFRSRLFFILLALLILIIIIIVIINVSKKDDSKKENNKPKTECISLPEVVIQENPIKLEIGTEKKVSFNLGTEKKCYDNLEYKIKDEKIATINEEGFITGKKAGKTILEVSKGYDKIQISVEVQGTEEKSEITAIKLSSKEVSIYTGKTYTMKVEIEPKNAKNNGFKWVSDDEKIAKVDQSGNITGVSAGKTIVTVYTTDEKYKDEVLVTVNKTPVTTSQKTSKKVTPTKKPTTSKKPTTTIPTTKKPSTTTTTTTKKIAVTKVTLSKTSVEVYKNNKYTLSAIISPSNATNKTVTWKSSNTNVATISSSGVVTAKSKGTATITATVDGKSVTCKITVTEKFIVKYNPGPSATGTMSDQIIEYGVSTPLKKNAFTHNSGYKFIGWAAKRSNNTMLGCTKSNLTNNYCPNSNHAWLAQDKIAVYTIYKDEISVAKTTNSGDFVTMYAMWVHLYTPKITCGSEKCDLTYTLMTTMKTTWDFYYKLENGSYKKIDSPSKIYNSTQNSLKGTLYSFGKGSIARKLYLKACLTQYTNICSNEVYVTLPKK